MSYSNPLSLSSILEQAHSNPETVFKDIDRFLRSNFEGKVYGMCEPDINALKKVLLTKIVGLFTAHQLRHDELITVLFYLQLLVIFSGTKVTHFGLTFPGKTASQFNFIDIKEYHLDVIPSQNSHGDQIIAFLEYLNKLFRTIMSESNPSAKFLIMMQRYSLVNETDAFPKYWKSVSLNRLLRYNFFLFAHPLIDGAENEKDFMGIACAALLGEQNSEFVTNLREFNNVFRDIQSRVFVKLLTETSTGSIETAGQIFKNLWFQHTNTKRYSTTSASSLSIPPSPARASSSSSVKGPAPPPKIGVTLEGILGTSAEPIYSVVKPREARSAVREGLAVEDTMYAQLVFPEETAGQGVQLLEGDKTIYAALQFVPPSIAPKPRDLLQNLGQANHSFILLGPRPSLPPPPPPLPGQKKPPALVAEIQKANARPPIAPKPANLSTRMPPPIAPKPPKQ